MLFLSTLEISISFLAELRYPYSFRLFVIFDFLFKPIKLLVSYLRNFSLGFIQ